MKSFILVAILFPMFSFAAEAGEMVLPLGMQKGKCEPCTLKDEKGNDFSFKADLAGKPQKIKKLFLEGTEFDVASDVEIYSDTYLPFYFVEFKGLKGMDIYALQAQMAVVNLYYHYFLKDKEGFHYLGRLPELNYDAGKNLFIGFEKFKNEGSKRQYRFLAGPKKLELVSGGN